MLSLAATVFGASAARAADPTAAICEILHTQQRAWNRGDIDGFMNGYARSRSTIFVSEDTVTRGWQTVRNRYKKKYSDREKMGTLTFSDLEITPLGPSAAIVIGRWQLKRKIDKPHGRFMRRLRDSLKSYKVETFALCNLVTS